MAGNVRSHSLFRVVGPAILLALVPLGPLAQGQPLDRQISRASVDSAGNQANAESWFPSLSADGRIVAFQSMASNLVPNDTNDAWDVFVHDFTTGLTTRISERASGQQASKNSSRPSVSADGRYVAFSSASGLVSNDTNMRGDVYLKDLWTGSLELISISNGGFFAESGGKPSISRDGRFVAFGSSAALIPGDSNGFVDVYVRDRQAGTMVRASVDSLGAEGNGDSMLALSISADGRHVAFETRATNLVPNDLNNKTDILVHDLQTGITDRVSVRSNGTEGNDHSSGPTLSADGRYVAFFGGSTNLVARDRNRMQDCFVHDRLTGTTTRVSLDAFGNESQGGIRPSISANGRFVAFDSVDKLVPEDSDPNVDVYVHDRWLGTTALVSASLQGLQSPVEVFFPWLPPLFGGATTNDGAVMSGDGKTITFMGEASDLVPRDLNKVQDIFVLRYR